MLIFEENFNAFLILAFLNLYKRATSVVFSKVTSAVKATFASTVSALTSVAFCACAATEIKRTKIKVIIVYMSCVLLLL